jgi:hypothetical protein
MMSRNLTAEIRSILSLPRAEEDHPRLMELVRIIEGLEGELRDAKDKLNIALDHNAGLAARMRLMQTELDAWVGTARRIIESIRERTPRP